MGYTWRAYRRPVLACAWNPIAWRSIPLWWPPHPGGAWGDCCFCPVATLRRRPIRCREELVVGDGNCWEGVTKLPRSGKLLHAVRQRLSQSLTGHFEQIFNRKGSGKRPTATILKSSPPRKSVTVCVRIHVYLTAATANCVGGRRVLFLLGRQTFVSRSCALPDPQQKESANIVRVSLSKS